MCNWKYIFNEVSWVAKCFQFPALFLPDMHIAHYTDNECICQRRMQIHWQYYNIYKRITNEKPVQ